MWLVARYLRVVAVHKWAIVVAGLDVNRVLRRAGLGVSLRRLVTHDLSKLSLAELLPYARHFDPARHAAAHDPEFAAAWRHHYERNDHHPEHFMQSDGTVARMPDEAVVEMVVDWMAASRAYEGSWPCCGGHWRWLEHSWDRLLLHPDNKALAGAIVHALGYATAIPGYDLDATLADLAIDARVRTHIGELRRVMRATPIREPATARHRTP